MTTPKPGQVILIPSRRSSSGSRRAGAPGPPFRGRFSRHVSAVSRADPACCFPGWRARDHEGAYPVIFLILLGLGSIAAKLFTIQIQHGIV
jgi:hypothetical protein